MKEDMEMNESHPLALREAFAVPRIFRLPSLVILACLCSATALADEPMLEAAPLSLIDFFKLPVGPRGLEPSAHLLALAGKRVEIAGYLVQQSNPSGLLIVAPVPVVIGDEDESYSDDLPAGVAYLHAIDAYTAETIKSCRGVLRVRGQLDIGRMAEDDGRQSFVRVQADAVQCTRTLRH